LQGELYAVMRDELKPNYLVKSPNRQRILNLCMEMAETLGPEVFANQSFAIQHRPDQCETLRSVTIPSLILCGKEDSLCPVSRHELMHDLIPGSRLAVIPNAGHLPTLEQPKHTNGILEQWLRV
jgi:pimeloyl-ACP methyl ester carboxylesterase